MSDSKTVPSFDDSLSCLYMHEHERVFFCERTIMEGKYNLEVTTNGIMESNNAIVLCHELLEIYERDCSEIQNRYGYGQITG